MCIAARWLRCLTDKAPEFRIQHHADQNLDELRQFWGRTLCIELDAIKLQRKSNSNQLAGRLWRSRYGVLTMRVADTLLRARMQAWMDRIREDWR
jgi:hypothetical protein